MALALVSPAPASAQQPGVSVRGIAYDSLRGQPLDGAIVSIVGTGKTTVADRRGRFQFDSVAPGTYTFVMNHDALDSLGLPAMSSRQDVIDGRAEVRIAIPSFDTFWSAACGRRAPRDSVLVYGTVRHAGSLAPVAHARVQLAWMDLDVRNRKQITQQAQTLTVAADSNGAFGFCGAPRGPSLRIRASTDSAASGVIDLPSGQDRVRWRPLTVGMLVSLDSAQVGTVDGVVMRGAAPFAGARVIVDEQPEVRTDDQGKFTVYNVPGGTRGIQVLGVGADAATRTVDVTVNSRTSVVINLERMTTLAAARVTGTAFIRRMAEGLAERRKSSFGVFLDSTDFVGHGTARTAFESVPGLKVMPSGRNYLLVLKEGALNECAANIFLDGVRQMDQERLWSLNPGDIKAVEVYKRSSTVPPEFQVARSSCGSVAVWTRRTFP